VKPSRGVAAGVKDGEWSSILFIDSSVSRRATFWEWDVLLNASRIATILTLPENLPIWGVKPVAESAPCPVFQVTEIGKNSIKGDGEDGNLQECVV
jgi:hypothetical protein